MLSSLDFKDRTTQGGFILLCLAALAFPFSVAACNIALGACLIAGLISGQYIAGLRRVWQQHRTLSIAWLAYLALLPIGLLWSLDVERGIQIIGRQWFWLAIPLVVEMLRHKAQRETFVWVLCIGLGLNLLFCLAQFLGFVTFIEKSGSSVNNPTGYIGHTSFGLVYGIWAAFLLHWSTLLEGWRCWVTRLLAVWSAGAIFLASGRGGYLVVAVLLLVMLWRLINAQLWLKLAVSSLAVILMFVALSFGPGKERMLESWQSIQGMEQGNFQNKEARWSLWYAAIEAWRQHKPLGVGTGGYHVAAVTIKQQHSELFYGGESSEPAHPHNMLFQSLARWGPPGVLLFTALMVVWIREGWRNNWHTEAASCLIALTGIALFVQGLTQPSFEEHFPGLLTALLLGTGLAARGPVSDSPA